VKFDGKRTTKYVLRICLHLSLNELIIVQLSTSGVPYNVLSGFHSLSSKTWSFAILHQGIWLYLTEVWRFEGVPVLWTNTIRNGWVWPTRGEVIWRMHGLLSCFMWASGDS